MQSSADVRTGAGPRSGFIRGRPFTELPKALPIAIIDNDQQGKHAAGRGRVESVEIDHPMGRTLAVTIVPYPPGIPVIMPGQRITPATKSIQDHLLDARVFDTRIPGFETDIHGLRFESTPDGRRYLVDCITGRGQSAIPTEAEIVVQIDPSPVMHARST